MKHWSKAGLVAALLGVLAVVKAQVPAANVLTQHNDIYRSGVYPGETTLRPANVNSRQFGKISVRRVLGQIWGQPLYVRGVPVPGGLRNVVYVATAENMVYGFDADDPRPAEETPPLMSISLGPPRRVPQQSFYTIFPSNGISSTPVIDLGSPPDPGRGTLYVVAELSSDNKFHIFALSLTSLAITRSIIVAGTAPGQDNGKPATISFDNGYDHLNRPSLLISRNNLVVAFGSGPNNDQDRPHFHGWVMSYRLPDLVQTGTFVTTPSVSTALGSIWQSGSGPAADDEGNVYVMSGNGKFQTSQGLPDLADSFIKLANGSLALLDWYASPSVDMLEDCDLDLGSSGPAVMQGVGKVLGAGKSGILYVMDKEHMGRTDPPLSDPRTWRGAPDCTTGNCFRVAENQYQPATKTKLACTADYPDGDWSDTLDSYPHVHGSPVVWNLGNQNFNLYVWAEQDFLKAFHFTGGKFSPDPAGTSSPVKAAEMSMPGAVLSLSWDGANANTGIVWTSRPDPSAQQLAADKPVVSVFHDQQHFVFRNRDGGVWDSYYARATNTWNLQQVNYGGIGASAGPAVSVFADADQQHFAYLDGQGNIRDAYYWRGNNEWHFQQIATNGHTPVGRLFVQDFHDQQHFVWKDGAGAIWDSYYAQADHNWHFQSINTGGHPAAGDVFVSVFGSADQQHFTYPDSAGNLWDSFYWKGANRWSFQQINTHGHRAIGRIFVSAFHDQQHFVWRDSAGAIWDSFFSQADNQWHFQQINTGGHPAAGDVFVSVFDSADQQHFAYPDSAGNIWDSFYWRGGNRWSFQQINTHGHAPSGGIAVSAFFDQQHFAWKDSGGLIWDSFFSQADNQWHFQEVNTTINCMVSTGKDLTPNGAPCNAIDQHVRGILEAFVATPGATRQMTKLWDNTADRSDGVWFAKQSPPTIAGGKVFLAGLPPPVPGAQWSAPSAYGQLVIYGLRPARR